MESGTKFQKEISLIASKILCSIFSKKINQHSPTDDH